MESRDEGEAVETGVRVSPCLLPALFSLLAEGGASCEVARQEVSLFFRKVSNLYPVFFFLLIQS